MKPGRPPLDPASPSVTITITLPAKVYDAYCLQALKEQRSLPAVLRQALEKKL